MAPCPMAPALRSISALLLRDLSATHGRARGGYLWAVGEPAAGIALLTLVFAAAFEAPPLGLSFALFYATGMVPFAAFSSLSTKLAHVLHAARPLLAFPPVSAVHALTARFLLGVVTELTVAALIFSGILLLFETRTMLDPPLLALALSLALALGGGIGALNAALILRFPAYQQVWSILMKPLFILSCIFFLFDEIPAPYQSWLWFNPLVHVVGLTRAAFYGGYEAGYVSSAYVALWALGALSLGLALLRHDARDLLAR